MNQRTSMHQLSVTSLSSMESNADTNSLFTSTSAAGAAVAARGSDSHVSQENDVFSTYTDYDDERTNVFSLDRDYSSSDSHICVSNGNESEIAKPARSSNNLPLHEYRNVNTGDYQNQSMNNRSSGGYAEPPAQHNVFQKPFKPFPKSPVLPLGAFNNDARFALPPSPGFAPQPIDFLPDKSPLFCPPRPWGYDQMANANNMYGPLSFNNNNCCHPPAPPPPPPHVMAPHGLPPPPPPPSFGGSFDAPRNLQQQQQQQQQQRLNTLFHQQQLQQQQQMNHHHQQQQLGHHPLSPHSFGSPFRQRYDSQQRPWRARNFNKRH